MPTPPLHEALFGRWHLVRTLTRHDESCVLLIRDPRQSDQLSVMKLIRADDASAIERARREYQALRRVRHPSIAVVRDFGRISIDARASQELGRSVAGRELLDALPRNPLQGGSDAQPGPSAVGTFAYLTFDHFDGLHLDAACRLLFSQPRPGDSPDGAWRPFLAALARICEALDHVHRLGLVHYDLKPANLLVSPSTDNERPSTTTPELEVRIVDFGLTELETTPTGPRARGTLPFIAPEVLHDGFADRRSDLFSLGVAIAWSLLDRSPFAGETPAEWIRSASEADHPHLQEIPFGPPRGLAELLARLLSPDPDDRPANAGAIISELERLGGFEHPREAMPLWRPVPTIGWERELSAVHDELEQLQRDDAATSLVLFEADEHQFTGRFVEEIEAIVRGEDGEFACGHCSVPRAHAYAPFVEILAQASRWIDLSAPRWDRFRDALRTLTNAGAEIEPAVGGEARDAGSTLRHEALGAEPLVDQLTELFLEIGRGRPFVACFRDLHLADASTLKIIESIVRNLAIERAPPPADLISPSATARPSRLLLVGTSEPKESAALENTDEEPPPAHLEALTTGETTRRLPLKRLAPDRAQEWIAERAPSLEIASETIAELLEASEGRPRLLDELLRRMVTRTTARGASRGLPTDLAQSLEDVVLERAARLPRAGRELLEILAVAGPRYVAVRDLALHVESDGVPARTEKELDHIVGSLVLEDLLEARERNGSLEVTWACGTARSRMMTTLDAETVRRHHALHYRICVEAAERDPVPCAIREAAAHHAFAGASREEYLANALSAARDLVRLHDLEGATSLYTRALDVATAAHGGTCADLHKPIHEELSAAFVASGQWSRAIEKLSILQSLTEDEGDRIALGGVLRVLGEAYAATGELTNATHFLERSVATLRTLIAERGSDADAPRRDLELCRSLLAVGEFSLERSDLARCSEQLEECESIAAEHPELREERARALLLLSEARARENDHAKRLELAREAHELIEPRASTRLLARSVRTLSEAYEANGDAEAAIAALRAAIAGFETTRAKSAIAECYNSLGTVHYRCGDFHEAWQSYEHSLLLSRQIGDDLGVAKSFNNLGNVCRYRERTDRASEFYKLAIDTFSRLNAPAQLAASLNNLSGVLEREGHYSDALEYAFRALQRRKRTRSTSGIAFSYYRIGMIYQSKGELAKALGHATKSLRLREQLDSKVDLAFSHLQLAELHLSLGELARAWEHCRQGTDIFAALENRNGVIIGRELRARIQAQLGFLEEAQGELEAVVEEARRDEASITAGEALLHLGQLLLETGQLVEAERRLVEAEKLFRSIRHQRRIVESLLSLGVVHFELGRPERAEGHLEEAYSLLEKLGIRDLVPAYFLAKSRLEWEDAASSLDEIEKLLQRGLQEARGARLPDLEWRFHSELGQLETRRGDLHRARLQFQEAREDLEILREGLSPELSRNFLRLGARAALVKLCSRSAELPESEPVTPPEAPASTASQPQDTATPPAPVGEEPPAHPLEDPTRRASMHQALLRLHEIIVARSGEMSLDRLLERIMDAVVDLSNAERGFLIVQDDRLSTGRIVVARNFDKEEIVDPKRKYSASVAEQVMQGGEPVLAGDALSEEPFDTLRSVRDLRLRSILCVPLQFQNETLGVIYVDNRHRRHAFQLSELKTLQTFSDQAAIAIATARLLDAKEHSNMKLRNQVEKQSVRLVVAQRALADRQSLLESRYSFGKLVGRSEAMQRVFYAIRRACESSLPVLIVGESGTGKDMIARAIHFNSERRDGPFVSENCAAINDSLLESELFGHASGAFSGATRSRKGLFGNASGGSLLLDEVSDMSLAMQQRLLRVLETSEVRPVGSDRSDRVDVRTLAACNTDLESLVAEGKFREDLFFRLNGLAIRVPPLRERTEDIPDLVQHFVARCEERRAESRREARLDEATETPKFSPEAMHRLLDHSWPGNVRELKHLVERTLLVAPRGTIGAMDVMFDSDLNAGRPREADSPRGLHAEDPLPAFRAARNNFEKHYVQRLLEEAAGNVAQAAKRSGLSRESLYRLLKKHDLYRPNPPPAARG